MSLHEAHEHIEDYVDLIHIETVEGKQDLLVHQVCECLECRILISQVNQK
jgi:hypothetical protein